MRKNSLLLLLAVTVFILNACTKDTVQHTYTIARPVLKDKAEVLANIKSNAPRGIESPGKFFMSGSYIFLNEIDKGIHIIDNSNPAAPVVKAFINIPGNLDIAVKGNTLYADLYADLVVIDITNPQAVRFEKNIPHVFPNRAYGIYLNTADTNKVIADWIMKDTTVSSPLNTWYNKADVLVYTTAMGAGGSGPSAASVPGLAGSMARFSVVNNYLYCVNLSQLRTFDISSPLAPQQTSSINMGWSIETIYPFQNNLFIGSTNGMFIYNITNPAVPVRESQFAHARSCDPVVTDGSLAFVTLRDGTTCGNFTNQLDVLDVSNITAPRLLHSYPMTHPMGLGKQGNLLFICDGTAGLKMYNADAAGTVTLIKQVPNIEPYDLIAWNNRLVVVARDGLYQYDYSNPSALHMVSKLNVNRK